MLDNDVSVKNLVPIENLRFRCDPNIFQFETTKDFKGDHHEIIGQQRALQAMEFGLSVTQEGYNIFISGPSGSGKTTFAKQKVERLAKEMPTPSDWCYVFNFKNADRPLYIELPAGKGKEFQRDISMLLESIKIELHRAFSSDEYNKKKREILTSFERKSTELWRELTANALEQGFGIERTTTGINVFPIKEDQPLSSTDYQSLSNEEREKLEAKGKLVEEMISETMDLLQKIEREMVTAITSFMKETAKFAIHYLFKRLLNIYKDHDKIIRYLIDYEAHVIDNYKNFFKKNNDNLEEDQFMQTFVQLEENQLDIYTVNVLIDNSDLHGRPVIYETNPTFQNLVGKIEYKGGLGNWRTDISHIKPGALHQANGGYLILQASQLFKQPYAWNGIKRMLLTRQISIEGMMENDGVILKEGLKPEPIPLNLKVIIIGSPSYFTLLSDLDEDFYKLFKVRVEFHTEMNNDIEHCLKMASFVKQYSEEEGLLAFHRRAVARVIDFSARLVEDQRKLSTRFQDVTKILVESSYWATKDNVDYVDVDHIEKSILEQNYRSNYVEERLHEMIIDGTIMVDTNGFRVGQINGLAVTGTRDHRFGLPSRITAQTFIGRTGIANIERETALSGEIHNKGLLILSGFLSGMFAKDRPLPLSASITFEQTYNMVDGDSASSAELYVLLSSLSEIPINQGIAVTGSVNQWGEIQPIGGVNEKIEGFYYICKKIGFNGEQGVIIPHQNVKNLMLKNEVVEAVQAGYFHIWAIKHIAEGIEILTGIHAGHTRNTIGEFAENTIFAKVEERFNQMYNSAVKK